jgi:hypothetical protein|tara:strand:- start:117 stop:758 length:642 start_codon:yes stop_codon:yes gene_type:complete
MNLTIKGDTTFQLATDVEAFNDIVKMYDGNNHFIKDVLYRVENKGSVTVKQISAVVKSYKSDLEYKEKNEERLARLVPMKDGKGEVIGQVVSIKQQPNPYDYGQSYVYKMLVEDFRGYRVFGTIPRFYLELEEELKPGDFVKFDAKLKQKELGFGFYSYPKNGVVVDGETAKITKEELEKLKPKKKDQETINKEKAVLAKQAHQRELMDFLSA